MKSIKEFISSKLVKDERIENHSNKVKAEAFNIMMTLAFIYIVAQATSIDLGGIEEMSVFILFMVGAFYTTIKLTIKGLSNYSPIKGMHPTLYITLVCGIASVFFGLFTAIKNTNLYLDGQFSDLSITVFVISAFYMFVVTEVLSLVLYYVSKKREQKETED